MDTLFNEIIKKLKEIHKKYPTLRFGDVLQSALDFGKRRQNVNLSDVSSKEINLYLEKYKEFLDRRGKK
jgi:hypothetical protein